MRRQDPCPGLAPLPRIMSWRPAATTTPLASSGRGRALTRRMADYFGLSYPHEIHSRGLAPHCVDPSEGQLRMAGCCCNHPGSYKIIARDVGTVTGMLDGEPKERSALFQGASTPLRKRLPDTTSWSFGRRPSIATSDRSSLILRLTAELNCQLSCFLFY